MSTGVCPMCLGSGKKLVDGRTWEEFYSGELPAHPDQIRYAIEYGKISPELVATCTNCGGYENVRPNGRVPLREDGTPCMHEFEMVAITPTAEIHKCKHCGYQYRVGE